MSRVILLTGASGRFGRIFVDSFLKTDYKVIALTGRQSSADQLRKDFSSYKDSLFPFAVDLMAEDAVDNVLEFINATQLQPDTLINNARSLKFLRVDSEGVTSPSDFSGEFTVGVTIPYQLTIKLSTLSETRLKSVIFISSMYGLVAQNPSLYENPSQDTVIQYGTVKAAQIHLTKELAVRLAPKNIRVNAVSYGGLEGRVNQTFLKKYSALCPSGRMLNDDDIPGPVEFLASDNSSAVTGQNIIADGGWTAW